MEQNGGSKEYQTRMQDPLYILHLEDSDIYAVLVADILREAGVSCQITRSQGRAEFEQALSNRSWDIVLVDNAVPGFSATGALQLARERRPESPVIVLSGAASERHVQEALKAGAVDHLLKDRPWQLLATIRRMVDASQRRQAWERLERHNRAMVRLVAAIQELSLARNLEGVMSVVRHAARELAGADGATFVLREGDQCFYADEDAIGPLWKGQRFPMSACISGWAMIHREPAVIPDIYQDDRIPVDAYRPTFVKSLVMVPIRSDSPVGAIGTYWASEHAASMEEVQVLQSLANTTAVAMENVRVYAELEQRVQERTRQLEAANGELEAFSYSVSHDLRGPLRSIDGFARLLRDNLPSQLTPPAAGYFERIVTATRQMSDIIDDLLELARITKAAIQRETINLSRLATEILNRLREEEPGRDATVSIETNLMAQGDPGLLRVVMENLLGNAWKYSSAKAQTRIEIGRIAAAGGGDAFFVRDHGAGFDMAHAGKLFAPFQRMHRPDQFPGTGVGLATVQRIIQRHGGRIWAEAAENQGATFYFTLPPTT